jgi:small conductance mechanosensitive channel
LIFIENIFKGINIDPVIVDAIGIIIILIAAFAIIKIVNYFIKKTGQRFDFEMTVIQVLQEIFKYSVIIIAVVMILNELGINVSALILSLGIVGVAVGFAARDTLSNFIAGLFIVGHQSFKVGDEIEVSNHVGTVTKMGFRTTTLMTTDKKVINVPNSLFSTNIYLNYTTLDKRRVELAVYIPYEIDLEAAIEFMEKKALKISWVLVEPKPKVLIAEFTDLGIKASLNVWTDDPWSVTENKSKLAREIKGYMEHENA